MADIYCEWTRLPDSTQPFEIHPVSFHVGCNGRVASGAHPIYPDVCPHCGRAVSIAADTEVKRG